ncbi:HU family DNA-binding protein [Pseudophaeobacter leonis]|uniref:HU family DNA-binding protein n=1 Tax=Pseudophaeobacter leonis TaxID=1144477 RepID=UPI001F4E818C|nr:HU family DNA-binding protein [Pseudophaeobacter leonis]
MSAPSDKTVSPPIALDAAQEPESKAPALNKKELIDEAVLRSGIQKKEAKPVVEALLAILGEAVASGRDLNLRPFGKLHLNRSVAKTNGTVHMCRLRQPHVGNAARQETDAAE